MPTNLQHLPDRRQALKLFDQLDTHKRGKLSRTEIGQAWKQLFQDLEHKTDITDAYQAADKNHDGLIARGEFEAFLRYVVYYDKFYHAFGLEPNKHVMSLVRKSFCRPAVAQGLCVKHPEMVFDLIPKAHTDKVTYEEFCSWLAQHTCQWDLQLGWW